jgi:hyperosmotically inducible protein
MRRKEMKIFQHVVLVISLMAFLVPAALAVVNSDQPQDKAIKDRVISELDGIRGLEMKNVQVTVDNGIVTLNGTIPSLWIAQEAVGKAKKVKGVTSVTDKLVVAANATEQEIGRQAVRAVRMYPFYSIFDNINIQVNDGVVVLTGEVTKPWYKSDLGRLISQIAGVRAVTNNLDVLPLSPFDDQLRRRIALAVYRDPILSTYALRADPTIHIIVKNGDVRLEGVVLSQTDKAIAGRNARFAATFLNLENNLRVEKTS